MVRLFWLVVGALALLFFLRWLGVITGYLAVLVDWVLGLAWSMACPLFFLSLFYAPGLYRDLTGGVSRRWDRFVSHRREIDELKHKISQMGKAHHMNLLGTLYLRQGRLPLAHQWLQQARELEPSALDVQFKLGVCCFEEGDYACAVDLLEKVHAEKPDYDYGMAYLRLAQAHDRQDHLERAEEVYRLLLRFYPNQPEGSYCYAMLKARQGETDEARQVLREMIASMRLSPGFQRRRNRHWVLKARWWLWRNRS